MANRLKIFFRNSLRELIEQPIDRLLDARYQKFRRMGSFLEGGLLPANRRPQNRRMVMLRSTLHTMSVRKR